MSATTWQKVATGASHSAVMCSRVMHGLLCRTAAVEPKISQQEAFCTAVFRNAEKNSCHSYNSVRRCETMANILLLSPLKGLCECLYVWQSISNFSS
eukprot:jgi/Antlo1/1299/1459